LIDTRNETIYVQSTASRELIPPLSNFLLFYSMESTSDC
jgi:hypothetical protein